MPEKHHNPGPETEQILHRAAEGDELAQAALLERYREHLRRMIARVGKGSELNGTVVFVNKVTPMI